MGRTGPDLGVTLISNETILNSAPSRRSSSKYPKIIGIIPRVGSPAGGLLVTISGENLKSTELDLGTGSIEKSHDEGQNFKAWFERNDQKVPCDIDRMMTLHGKSLVGCSLRIFLTQGLKILALKIQTNIS